MNIEVTQTPLEPDWRAILNAMADPALVLDDADTVIHHNPLVVDLYPRVRTGSSIGLLSREPHLLTAIDQVKVSDERLVIDLHDRVPITRRMSAFVSRIAAREHTAGTPTILIVLRDLTDQQRHAQMRADFIAHASHELRTPLASLKVIVETLQGPAREDPVKRERFLSMMLTQATRMAQLIDDLLCLSRVEMNAHLPPRDHIDITAVLDAVVQTLEPLAEANDVKLLLKNFIGSAKVRGDKEELSQVFQNLVQNAIRYGRPCGKVSVVISRDKPLSSRKGRIQVAVTDDGIGIAPEHIPRLTERFYRVSAMDSRAKGGTGLGLAIVKHIVTRHRADLDIKSELGKGSTFTVSFDE
ncbi:MAG: ATP-binding protein, partial [Pseudomonadota bacterium]